MYNWAAPVSSNDTFVPDEPYTIKDAIVTSADGACPFQAYGTIFGKSFYFRLRHGSATLQIDGGYHNSLDADTPEFGNCDGVCSYAEFEKMFNALIFDFEG